MITASLNSRIIYTQTLEVQPQHCDVQNHLNNVVYVQWIQDGAIAAYQSKGYSQATDEQNQVIWIVRRHEVDYLAQAFVGEAIQLTTWVEEGTLSTFRRRTNFNRVTDDQLLCRAVTEWCYFNTQRNRPVKIPNEIKANFLPVES